MDKDKEKKYTFTVRPFGYTDGQHFTLVLDDTSDDYYLFYYVFQDKYGSITEGTSIDFLLSIFDFLHIKYKVEECDENIFNVNNFITSKNKEECEEWIDYVINSMFYDFTKDEDEENKEVTNDQDNKEEKSNKDA